MLTNRANVSFNAAMKEEFTKWSRKKWVKTNVLDDYAFISYTNKVIKFLTSSHSFNPVKFTM